VWHICPHCSKAARLKAMEEVTTELPASAPGWGGQWSDPGSVDAQ